MTLRSHRRQTVESAMDGNHRLAAVATATTAWQRWLRQPPLGSGGYDTTAWQRWLRAKSAT